MIFPLKDGKCSVISIRAGISNNQLGALITKKVNFWREQYMNAQILFKYSRLENHIKKKLFYLDKLIIILAVLTKKRLRQLLKFQR